MSVPPPSFGQSPDIIRELQPRLKEQHLLWRNLLADAGYSSGENYALLEQAGIESYMPPYGTYKGGPEGFIYDREHDHWTCRNGKHVTFRKVHVEKDGNRKRRYLTTRKDCKGCPFKEQCIPKNHEKRIDFTYDMDEYERAIARVKSRQGRYFKHKRSSTVEPVFGTLTQFMGLRRVNTRGIANANKVMLCAAIAYNLKKYLKFTRKRAESVAKAMQAATSLLFGHLWAIFAPYPTPGL